jgi:hypothetical protein
MAPARNAGLAGAILLSGEVARRPREPMRSDQDTGFRVPVAATASESLAILKDVGLLGGR